MHSGPISLAFIKKVTVKPGGELVPFYHFEIIDTVETVVGHINFKVGNTNHIRQCVGHIGYEILPEHQGNSYSYFACNAIRPFVQKFYNKVILTCDPENTPSIKIIEKLNGKFLNEVIIPKHDPSYKGKFSKKRRYEWML
jgi:predicted acetyltransferase